MLDKCVNTGDLIMLTIHHHGVFSNAYTKTIKDQQIGIVLKNIIGDSDNGYTDVVTLINSKVVVILEEEYEKIS